jgi:hypothetical protein
VKRRSEPHTSDQRLNAETARVEAAPETTVRRPQHDLPNPELRLIETALDSDGWVSSVGLQPPELTQG